ncbi:MAG: 2-amino-4-hydroxy-6-hydroxymethyldihydropteridine diphosphokinase [Phascolarctobacterium sp.]|nr:2-amino-4-hydroxy-6-hydroxymethyldihydropteridine diphosphokinase [Phascolarctobacterium sp.]
MSAVYIALGSNLGDREENLKTALKKLEEKGLEIIKVSSFFETEPYGVKNQPMFLNAACGVKTNLPPEGLLKLLLSIEQEMGRKRCRRWGERNIDLDLLFYDDIVLNTQDLILPHPDLQNRDFVLAPLMEIAPDFLHPVLKKTIKEIKNDMQNKGDFHGKN